LISIHFEKEQDCLVFFSAIVKYMSLYHSVGFHGDVQCQDNQLITIDCADHIHYNESLRPLLASLFVHYLIATKEESWLRDIVRDMFYFEEEEEQQQIVSIARSLLDNKRNIGRTNLHFQREDFIYRAFLESLEHDSAFYYEAFLTFRLREYFEQLVVYVEKAIDEYYLEQEYQTLVEQLRNFILKTKERSEAIHVVYGEEVRFYDKTYRHMKREELLFYLEEELVFEKGLRIEEMVISPLVSLVPGKVYMYANDFDIGVIHTMQAIFQERLTLLPLASFRYAEID